MTLEELRIKLENRMARIEAENVIILILIAAILLKL